MSVDFSQVKKIELPQGFVETITIGNDIVWQATRSWKAIQSSPNFTIIQYGTSLDGVYQNGTSSENRIASSSTNWAPHLYKVNGNNTFIKFTLLKSDTATGTNFTVGNYYYINTTGNLGIPSTDSSDWEAFELGDSSGEAWDIELDLRFCKNIPYTQIPMFVIRTGTNLSGSSYYACSIVAEYDSDKKCYYVGLVGSTYGSPYDHAVIRYREVSSYNLWGVPALDPGWTTIDETTRTIGSASTYSDISNFALLPNSVSKIRLTLKYTGNNSAPNNYTYYNTNMLSLIDANMGTTLLNSLLTTANTEFTLEFDYNPNRPYLFVVGGKRRNTSTSRDFYISLKQTASDTIGKLNLSLIKSGANEASIGNTTPASNYGIYPFSITKIEAYIP